MNVLLVCGFDSSHTRSHFYFAVCRCAHWLQDRSRTGVIIVIAAMELRSWCRNNVTCKECLVMGSAASPSSQTCFSVGPMVTEARKTSVYLRLPHSSCYSIWHDGFLLEDYQRWNSDVIRGPQKSSGRLTPTEHMPVRIHINSLMC